MKTIFTWTAALVAMATLAFAGVPWTINYQGYLTFKGSPASGTVNMTFSLYSSAKPRNNPVWRETQDVTPVNGTYSIQLGSTTPITAPFDVPYYLGVKAGTDTEMSPQPLSSVPYAQRAAVADGLTSSATIPAAQLAGGNWPLTSNLTIDTSTLVVDRVNKRVGIGTATPDSTLTVVSPASSPVRIGDTGCLPSANFAGIGLFGPMSNCSNYTILGENNTTQNLYINRPAGGDINFRMNNGNQMVLDHFGGLHLDASDANNGAFNHSATTGAGLAFGAGSGEGIASKRTAGGNRFGLDFYTSGTPRLSITFGGNVGIGTTAPGSTLTVAGPIESTVPTGIAPLVVASTTQVNNLNASMVGGKAAGDFVLKSDYSAVTIASICSALIAGGASLPSFCPGNTITDSTTGMVLQRVTGGTFTMGDTFGYSGSNSLPTHQVTVSDFYIGKYEVTQAEWYAVMQGNTSGISDTPSNFTACGASCPVEKVSWDDIQVFISRLNKLSGKSNYRLPTEAEWEYAARSGGQNQVYSGGGDHGAVAWNDQNSLVPYTSTFLSGTGTHLVGQKLANGLGLYDMSGNVMEWVSDWYGPYSSTSQTNPTGPINSINGDRVIRGGSWDIFGPVAKRYDAFPSARYVHTGFRLAAPVQ